VAGSGGSTGGGGGSPGTCTASKPVNTSATGSGPHKVTVETNSGSGINQGTIFRPADLGGTEKYPIFVWGEGGCSQDGLSNSAAMAEIASHGYFVIADGTPNGTGNHTQDRSMLAAMAAPLIGYIDWAIAENDKPCSAYYHSLDPTKVAANGFSCGGLMSQAMVLDPRIVTWGVNSSGMKGADQSYYDMIKTPVLFVEGGSGDIAYDGGVEGYTAIAKLNVPVLWLSKDLGHGGDLFAARGGDFTKIDVAWLNWWLKGDLTATGKGLLVGASCPYCSDSAWEYKSAHIP
jgi:dienelactone hydrolase